MWLGKGLLRFFRLSTSSTTVRHERKLPEPGTVLGEKYKLLRIIGEGGMGVVYEGEHVRMGQRVAIKMLLPETIDQADVVKRFDREARAAARLKSRHAARVTDVDHTPDGLPYMVMELLHGSDLGDILADRIKLPGTEAVDYMLQACAAIIEAHDLGIVHRDLKPANLFLSDGPDGQIVKLLDFGISKVTGETSKLTSAESMMGTPLYMSPEQIRSARDVDARTDVWSLGVILYELLSGDAPFTGTTTQVAAAIVTDDVPPILTAHGVSPQLQAVVLRALTKDRNTRTQSARDFAAALLPFALPSSTGAQAIEGALRSSVGAVAGASLAPPPSRSASTLNPTTEKKLSARSATSRVAMGLVIGASALAAAAVVALIVWKSGAKAPATSAIRDEVPRVLSSSVASSAPVVSVGTTATSADPASTAIPVPPIVTAVPMVASSGASTASSAIANKPQPGAKPVGKPAATPSAHPAGAGTGPRPPPSVAAPELPTHI